MDTFWLLIAIPLASAAILLTLGRWADRWGHWLGCLSIGVAFGLGLSYFFQLSDLPADHRAAEVTLFQFLQVGNLNVDLASSWMVGDSGVDIHAGQAVGCKTILVEHRDSAHRRTGKLEPDARAATLAEAAQKIIQMSDSQAKVVTDDRST